jgi:hypothetical protein
VRLFAALETEVAATRGGATDALDVQCSDWGGHDELAVRGRAPAHAFVAVDERVHHVLVVLLLVLFFRDELVEHLWRNEASTFSHGTLRENHIRTIEGLLGQVIAVASHAEEMPAGCGHTLFRAKVINTNLALDLSSSGSNRKCNRSKRASR